MVKTDRKASRKLSYIIMGGHICVDTVQGGLAAILPFLVMYGGYSYFEVSTLILASNLASAIIQPLFGWLGDRKARPWLMAAGVVLAGAGMAAIGVARAFGVLVGAAVVAGVGIAMLHPEGGRIANLLGGSDPSEKAVCMSLFSVGGQVGFCVGPVATVAAVQAFGLAGTLVYLAFCLPYAALMLAFDKRFRSFGVRPATAEAAGTVGGGTAAAPGAASGVVCGVPAAPPERWGAFSLVLGALSVRSIVYYGVTSFVPLFVVGVLGQSEGFAGSTITVFAFVGALATLAAGRVAPFVRTPALMAGCFAVMAVCFAVFAQTRSLAVALVLLVALAVAVNLFNPPAITLGQDFVPAHLGMASGLTFGVAVCVGGCVSPALGVLGDSAGLSTVIWALAAICLLGLALSAAVWVAADRGADVGNRGRAKLDAAATQQECGELASEESAR